MTADEFITFWKDKKNKDDTPAIGIGIFWDKISPQNCIVQQFNGEDAWGKMEKFWTPLWGGFKRTPLKEWLDQSRPDYQKFIDEEKNEGKIDLYDKNGLVYFYFCAFADETGTVGSMGDGCHRYIDCNYLILNGKDLNESISKCKFDVLCVPNLAEVLSDSDIPPTFQR